MDEPSGLELLFNLNYIRIKSSNATLSNFVLIYSSLCCKSLRVIGPGIMLDGYLQHLEGSKPTVDMIYQINPLKLFTD